MDNKKPQPSQFATLSEYRLALAAFDGDQPAAPAVDAKYTLADLHDHGAEMYARGLKKSGADGASAVDAAKLDDLTRYEVVIEPHNHYYRLREDVEPLGEYVKFADVAALVAQQAARIAELVSGLAAAREMVGHPDNVAFIDRALAGATQEGK